MAILCWIWLCFGITTGYAQQWNRVDRAVSTFPQQWEGTWTGTLQIHFPGAAPREVPMRLNIQPEDSQQWSWELIYNPGEQEDRRPYSLIPVDTVRGEWVIDEHNGIVLGGQVLGPVFVSRFEVGGQLLLARYGLEGDQLRFGILAGSMDGQETGGPQPDEPPLEATPMVTWYGVNVYQVALLRRE